MDRDQRLAQREQLHRQMQNLKYRARKLQSARGPLSEEEWREVESLMEDTESAMDLIQAEGMGNILEYVPRLMRISMSLTVGLMIRQRR